MTQKKSKKRVRYKYANGGEVSTPDPNAIVATGGTDPVTEDPAKPTATGPSAKDLKTKYKNNPYLVGQQNRYFWATQTDREFPLTGGNVRDAVTKAASFNKIDPALLYSSAMEEGMSGAIDTKNYENASEAYVQFTQKNPELGNKFMVDGFYNYGLDQFAGQAKSLEAKGYLPKGFSSNYTTFEAVNEKDEKIKAAAFDTDQNALIAKSAMMRQAQDQLNSYIKRTGTTLSDKQKEFFLLANYNAGEGNMQKMLDSYKQKGYLKDDKFLDPTFKPASFAGVYSNVQARVQAANLLRGEKIFAYGGKIPKYQNGTGDPIDPVTGQPKPAQLTNRIGIDVWQNAATSPVPINPNAPANEQIFPIAQNQQNSQNQEGIVPLSQMFNYTQDRFGNETPQGSGRYVDIMGNPNTIQDQQAEFDVVSETNRRNAEERDRRNDQTEMYATTGITAINAFFNKQNAARDQRTNRRKAIMDEIDSFKLNPFLEGTGSQAIMEKGGKIHIKEENRGKFTAAAKRAGKSVQAYAAQIMANPDNYSPTLRKRANFAKNAAKWHEFGGEIDNDNVTGDDLGIQTISGGRSEMISSSDHSNPMVKFTGKEHKKGGIAIGYAGNVAEVEDKEVGWIDAEGGLNIFGKLKLPGSNQTFRKTAENIAKREEKVDGQKSKYLNILNNGDQTDPYQETAISTSKVMFKSLDKQSRQIAEEKEALSSYQNLILALADQGKISESEMGYGGKMPKKPKGVKFKYDNGGNLPPAAYMDKTGLHDPRYKAAIMQMMANQNPLNFNTGDFEFTGGIRQVPMGMVGQDPTNFNTGDFQFQSGIQQVPKAQVGQTPYNFNTGDFEFQSTIQQVPMQRDFQAEGTITGTRKSGFRTGDFDFNSTITERRKRTYAIGGEIGPIDPNDLDNVQRIIDKYSKGKSPLKAQDFVDVSKQYGVPLDLMLAQAIVESNVGTEGRAVRTKNIFNVGNTDDGTESPNESWRAGLERYAKLIKSEYAKDPNNVSTQEIINADFVRPGKGGRYATDKLYTKKVMNVLNEISPEDNYTFSGDTPFEFNGTKFSRSHARSLYNRAMSDPEHGLNTNTTDLTRLREYLGLNADGSLVANRGSGSTGSGSTNTTAAGTGAFGDAFNYIPNYQPLPGTGGSGQGAGGSGAVDTPYGAAARQPTPFSDKANVSTGSRERGYLSPLAMEQIAPELLTIATNRRDPVPQLTYQPDLKQTFDISYQLGRNENQSTFNQVAKIAESTGNVDALSQLAAQKYKADEAYNMQEIQGNAQQQLQTYNQNVDVLNDAKLKNLALIADQQVKQAQSRFNTRQEDLSAFTSISGKVLQNQLENRTYNAYANLFKHYGFDKKGNVTFDPDKVVQKFTAGESQQFGLMAAQQGANAIMNGDFSRRFTRVKNEGGGTTTTETLGTNKKIQEEYKALKNQGFDDVIIGNMLRAKYPETITQD